jgi:DNA-binding transcriptional ArsR family regulator
MAKARANAAAQRAVLRIFALFGHPVRVIIFQRLGREPMTAGELAKGLSIGRPAVVQHLKRLESARLVDASMDGRRRVYRIEPAGLAPLTRWLNLYVGGSPEHPQ